MHLLHRVSRGIYLTMNKYRYMAPDADNKEIETIRRYIKLQRRNEDECSVEICNEKNTINWQKIVAGIKKEVEQLREKASKEKKDECLKDMQFLRDKVNEMERKKTLDAIIGEGIATLQDFVGT